MPRSIHADPWTVKVEAERIEVTSNSPRPDPDWRFTDAAGHEHYYKKDDRDRGGYPTLVWVQEDPYGEWGDEDDDGGRYECMECSEVIEPRTTGPSMFPEYINGPSSVSLTYDDGREHREYAILTAEDVASLTDPETRQATINRIASTQEPLTRTTRFGMQFEPSPTPYVPPALPSSAEAIIARQAARRLRDELFVNPGRGWFIKGGDTDAPGERFIYHEAMDAAVEAAVKATLS